MLAASSLALFATPIPKVITTFIVIAISTFFLLCSFLKIGEQNFDKFFFYAIKYLFRKKNFVYRRCGRLVAAMSLSVPMTRMRHGNVRAPSTRAM